MELQLGHTVAVGRLLKKHVYIYAVLAFFVVCPSNVSVKLVILVEAWIGPVSNILLRMWSRP